MGIGTSRGAFYQDEHHQAAEEWKGFTQDRGVITPEQLDQSRQMDAVQMQELGGIEVKDQMPFPNNSNPDSNFVNRFGSLPPSGILNDLKRPPDNSPALVRRIGDKPEDHPEMVDKAALQYGGKTYTGINHGYALQDIMNEHGSSDNIDFKSVKDGFTTTTGRFVSREEAMDIAKAQDQIDQKVKGQMAPDSSMLLSEDLSHLQPAFYP